MQQLQAVLEKALENFGKMPISSEEQQQFIKNHIVTFQNWLNENNSCLEKIKKNLPLPSPTDRYGRNLILSLPEKNIYVFLHLLNPGMETPMHWHSENGVGALAFAASLDEGICETKWTERSRETPLIGRKIVQLALAQITPCAPWGLHPIHCCYGAHKMTNTSKKIAGLLEIYFEPQPLNNLDLPIPILHTQDKYVEEIIPTSWLPDLNLLKTAEREKWPKILLSNEPNLLDRIENRFFAVIDHQTVFIPHDKLKQIIGLHSILLKGPENRYLISKKILQN